MACIKPQSLLDAQIFSPGGRPLGYSKIINVICDILKGTLNVIFLLIFLINNSFMLPDVHLTRIAMP